MKRCVTLRAYCTILHTDVFRRHSHFFFQVVVFNKMFNCKFFARQIVNVEGWACGSNFYEKYCMTLWTQTVFTTSLFS